MSCTKLRTCHFGSVRYPLDRHLISCFRCDMWDLYQEMLGFLGLPGKLGRVDWEEAYCIREHLEIEKHDTALWMMIGLLSKVAMDRRVQLPDVLHNMMILNSGGVEQERSGAPEWWLAEELEKSRDHVGKYVDMLVAQNMTV